MKKYVSTALVIITVATVVFCLWQVNETRKLNDILAFESSARKKAEKTNSALYMLIKADGDVILNGNFSEALSVYEKMLTELPDSINQIIENRITHVRKVETDIQTVSNTGADEHKILKNRQIVSKLKNENDSLISVVSDISDVFKSENEKLRSENAKLNKALTKRDRLTVISFPSSKGEKIQYLGEVENGKAQGGGVGIWPTGSIYRGEWDNNQRHGQGKFEWADGEIYEGSFIHDRREGQGTYKWPSGERYEGEWLNNQRHGYGILYNMDGNERYRGQWKQDVPVQK